MYECNVLTWWLTGVQMYNVMIENEARGYILLIYNKGVIFKIVFVLFSLS